MRCTSCEDTGWVCETHPSKPWNGPKACGCGAAGMPCSICNGDGHVSRVLKSVLAAKGKRVQ